MSAASGGVVAVDLFGDQLPDRHLSALDAHAPGKARLQQRHHRPRCSTISVHQADHRLHEELALEVEGRRRGRGDGDGDGRVINPTGCRKTAGEWV